MNQKYDKIYNKKTLGRLFSFFIAIFHSMW